MPRLHGAYPPIYEIRLNFLNRKGYRPLSCALFGWAFPQSIQIQIGIYPASMAFQPLQAAYADEVFQGSNYRAGICFLAGNLHGFSEKIVWQIQRFSHGSMVSILRSSRRPSQYQFFSNTSFSSVMLQTASNDARHEPPETCSIARVTASQRRGGSSWEGSRAPGIRYKSPAPL